MFFGLAPGTMWGRITCRPARCVPACWPLAGSAAATVEGVKASTSEQFGFHSVAGVRSQKRREVFRPPVASLVFFVMDRI